MPLNAALKNEVNELSRKNTQGAHNQIYELLSKAINSGEATPKDILEYTNTQWPETKRKVINAATLNRLGVFLVELDNPAYFGFIGRFFEISADRDNSWGCHNFAFFSIEGYEIYGINQSLPDALAYAKKAVDLTKNSSPHIHRLVYAKALKANGHIAEANAELAKYLNFCLKQPAKDFQKAKAQEGIEFLEELLIRFFDTEMPVEAAIIREKQEQVELLLGSNFRCPADTGLQTKLDLIKQQLLYLRGVCFDLLGHAAQAMQDFCAVDKINPKVYELALRARVQLLKTTVKKIVFNEIKDTPDVSVGITQELAETSLQEKKSATALITEIVSQQIAFSSFWQKGQEGNNSFDFVFQSQQEESYVEKTHEIDILIQAKELEIKLFKSREKLLLQNDDEKQVEEVKELLALHEIDLAKLKQAKKIIDEKYNTHKPQYRQLFRRGQAEARFFNPSRMKNKEAIVELASQIIDQRFGLADSSKPVILTDVSVRQLAAAEKAFQSALIYLTQGSKLMTGIPIARKESWSFGGGYNNYGPVETYKVGETEVTFEHRENPKPQRLGDSYSPQHGTYDRDIYPFFHSLTQGEVEKERILVRLLINYGKSQKPVLLADLQSISPYANIAICNQFNRACAFIMVKEQTQWLSATEPVFCGLSVLHARCLLLIEKGFLRLAEVFKNDGFFSVYSNRAMINNTEKLLAASEIIDALYAEYLKVLHVQDSLKISCFELKNKEKISIVETRKQAHKDLQVVYGGADDSENEDDGYNSELEFPSPRI